MLLLPAPNDDHAGLSLRLVSENQLVHMGIYKVMFGHRVRAGFVDDKCGVSLDWCGGANWKDVERLYSLAKAILEKRIEDRNCFAGLPTFSVVKPFVLDLDFVKVVSEAAGDFQLVQLEKFNVYA